MRRLEIHPFPGGLAGRRGSARGGGGAQGRRRRGVFHLGGGDGRAARPVPGRAGQLFAGRQADPGCQSPATRHPDRALSEKNRPGPGGRRAMAAARAGQRRGPPPHRDAAAEVGPRRRGAGAIGRAAGHARGRRRKRADRRGQVDRHGCFQGGRRRAAAPPGRALSAHAGVAFRLRLAGRRPGRLPAGAGGDGKSPGAAPRLGPRPFVAGPGDVQDGPLPAGAGGHAESAASRSGQRPAAPGLRAIPGQGRGRPRRGEGA